MTGRALRQRIADWIGGPETHTLRAQVTALAEQCVYLESDAALIAAEHAAAEAEADVRDLEDLLGAIELYVKWRWVTKQLTTPQKERWADAVEAWSARLNDGTNETTHVDRWWRDDEEATRAD